MAARNKILKTTETVVPELPIGPDAPHVISALREDNPRDFLASLGLLKLVNLLFPECYPALSWTVEGHPVIHAQICLPEKWMHKVVDELKAINAETPHPFVHHKVIKVNHGEFRHAILRSLEKLKQDRALAPLSSTLYAAYGSQVYDAEKNEVAPSAFSFSNGQGGKELLRDIREMIDKEFTPSALHGLLVHHREALCDAKSFRWHPAEFRAAAYRAADPGASVKGDVFLDFACANILAFIGLTFFPVVDLAKESKTTGHSRAGFTWPTWTLPLRPDVITCLLHQSPLHEVSPTPRILQSLGCAKVWRSRRFNSDKSLYFAPATCLC